MIAEMGDCFALSDHVAVLAVYIEQVSFMRPGMPIANTFADHDGAEAVLGGVDRAGADAAAGRTANKHHGVDPQGNERGGKRCPDAPTRILLAHDEFAL